MSALPHPHSNSFSAHLALNNDVSVTINAPTLHALQHVVKTLQPAEAANDTGKPAAAATAPAGASGTSTAASSATTAAAPAAQAEAGNGTAGQAAAASTASSTKPEGAAEVTFEQLKKAFLALSTKADGRTKCQKVLEPFKVAKLSEAKPEQYAAVAKAIEEAAK